MQLLDRRLHVATQHLGQHLQGAVDGLVDGRLVLGRRLLQHVVGAFRAGGRLADAQAQAPVVVRAQALRDVPQAVVPGDAAALLDARDAGCEVELVVHHQDLFGLELEEACEHLHRLAAQVHERLRQQEPGAGGILADQRLELRVLAQHEAAGLREALDQPEPRVVPRALVLLARIAQADHQPYHFLSFLSALSAGLSAPALGAAFSPGLAPSAAASPSFGSAACAVVGTSAADTTAAASSSSVISCGTTTVATAGLSSFFSASSTPCGSLRSRAWIELPTASPLRSTSMNSGRSSGRQVMSISFCTWLTTPPWSFTPGDFSALTKCSGTFMCSFLFFSTRWKSTCSTCGR